MTLADVNVLIYAFRRDAPHHQICRNWLENTISGTARFGISTLVLSGVVRVVTNPRAFKMPSACEEAFEFCDNLIHQPNCQIVDPGEKHWSIFKHLCIETGTSGARATDAWFAALAIESGCEWVTLDRDFARFPGLKWHPPSAEV